MAKHNPSLFRAIHKMNKGGLHRALGVDPNKPIPAEKLAAAKNSSSPHIRRMAAFAHTLAGFKH
jgi:hypothetical protein